MYEYWTIFFVFRRISMLRNKALVDCSKRLLKQQVLNGTVTCQLCDVKLKTIDSRNKKTLLIEPPLNHACRHLDKMIFACLLCENRYTCRIAVTNHIISFHKQKVSTETFLDYSSDYQQELVNILHNCFDPVHNKNDRPVR